MTLLHTYLDGNGATLRRHKLHDATPEHICFDIAIGSGEDKISFMGGIDVRKLYTNNKDIINSSWN